jgi:DNA polymerase-3 subunit epsilon
LRKSKIICIDIETTGLDKKKDEILQISIINGRGKTLYNSYIKPDYLTDWKEAEAINKISWDCVKYAPSLLTEKRKIDRILRKAGLIIGYNHKGFDLPFLAAKGIDTAVKAKIYDVMLEFAYIYGEYNKERQQYKWQKLTTCAGYYGYTNYSAHDALEDVRATLHCYHAMRKDRKGRKAAKRRKREELKR